MNQSRPRQATRIPLWLKLICTLFVCILIPVYWVEYGPLNFLWFSDIALFGLVVALWRESALLASMMCVAVLLPETVWNIVFFIRLFIGLDVLGLAGYMFDPAIPYHLRALSLFHVFLPVLILWAVYRLGYDRRAFVAQSLLVLIILPITWLITDPAHNINWVYGPGSKPQEAIHPLLYLTLEMLAFPLLIYLPTHLLLQKLFTKP